MNNICKDKDQPAENIVHKVALQSELWAGDIRDVTMKQILCYERSKGSRIWTESFKNPLRIYKFRFLIILKLICENVA
jgi:hypothetical protein